MLLSIVIPTYNRIDLLKQCLLALGESLNKVVNRDQVEVILTDDSTNDSTRTYVQEHFKWVTWIKGPQQGPAANRNNGARHTKGSWLFFLDDDCLPDQNIVGNYIEKINEGQYNVLEGRIIADRPQERYDEVSPLNIDGGKLWSCNFVIERSLFDSIQGFDERFKYAAMEDVDFFNRVKKTAKILFVKGSFVVHPWRRISKWSYVKVRVASQKQMLLKSGKWFSLKYRLSRVVFFIKYLYLGLAELKGFKFKGAGFYLKRIVINFLLIVSI